MAVLKSHVIKSPTKQIERQKVNLLELHTKATDGFEQKKFWSLGKRQCVMVNPVSRVACEGNVSVEFSAFRILDVCAVKNAQTETFPAQA